MDKFEKQIESEVLFRGRILTLTNDTVALPDGRAAGREVVHHRGAVAILAINDRDELLMVRQYRHPVGRELLEIPAGRLEEGENPADCARRELREETGALARTLDDLGFIYPTCGYSTEKIHLYLATELTDGRPAPDEGEFVETQCVPLEQALVWCGQGKIPDAKTQCALLQLLLRRSPNETSAF